MNFEHLEFPDHYNFKTSDIDLFRSKKIILTTEKDYVRLSGIESLKDILYYLPIQMQVFRREEFNKSIKAFIS